MITWLVGENTFEIREALQSLKESFAGTWEQVDAAELSLHDLPDLLMGVSLFSSERLVIIRDISQNSSLWEKLPEWLPRINDDIHVVFIDTKPDKRTSSYKELKAVAELSEFPAWGERDVQKAEQWVGERAATLGLSIDRRATGHLVNRVGLDQWQLSHALDILSLVDAITRDVIDDVIPQNLNENIFQLFETALDGKTTQVVEKLRTLALQEDPYALFALLSSQALTLAAVTFAGDEDMPSKDLGIHPFVASKLARYGKKLGRGRVGAIVEAFAKTDADLKRSRAEPWLLVERTLLEVSR